MKSILLVIALFLTANFSVAQDYLGTWSFQSIDTASLDEEIPEETITTLSAVFQFLKVTINPDETFEISMMGQSDSGSYTVDGDQLLLGPSSEKFTVKENGLAQLQMGNARLLLSKGAIDVPAKKYILKDDYEPIAFTAKQLVGKWKSLEVKASAIEESPEMTETMLATLETEFNEDFSASFGALGFTQELIWSQGDADGILLLGIEGSEPKTYEINFVDESHLMMTLVKTGTILYLKKQ
ncbi:hypothetical protein [Nonlabens ponticola]|uniref:Lipocalin-like domain-containing protein n=1 Tax=Nonlabens ponticola TaxID=2496866 RepID=A0A3S9MWX1_9FLAO|nr:hypothetical protein [Nonlabens ponticola]AZQ43637.1 hypothetical protein EJ995_05090 [Nonlabens ponticola]